MSRISELHAGLRPQLEVVVTRTFDAPAELVFRMWTEPEHFARWWGPKGFTNPVCELDARPGGAILVHMRAPNGSVYPMTGTFREIVPCERLVFTSIAEDGEGNAALDEITTVPFAAEGSKTRVTVRSKAVGLAPAALGMLAGMEKGWSQSMDRLATSVVAKAATGEVRSEDEAQIRKVLADRASALHDKDSALAVAHLAEDAVMFTLAPPLEHRGAKARDRSRLEAWFATWRGPIGWELHDPDISVGGDVAFVRALGHMTGTKVDGEQVDLWTRTTVCLHRIGGAWRIVHEHTSVPFYMDGSFRAAVDLEPQPKQA
jgi:uncharacterized protein YndB with AHSA1/START domain/ketosteroid isomerase-like protein